MVVFFGSYLPLSLILLAQDYDYSFVGKDLCWQVWTDSCSLPFKNPGFAIGIFLGCIVCLIIAILSLHLLKPKHEIIINEAKHVPADLMNYTLPYVVSFMSIDYQEPGKFLGFLIFLGWMFWITYRSGQVILNPVLIVLGWRLYDATYTYAGSPNSKNSRLLVKGTIEAGKRYRQVPLQDILIVKANEGGRD
ncbi:hypothetical protein CK223_04075 [Mesorhizobium loti]|nr:hypothetical protein CK223_04075 [Mesorhizobium loti]